MNSFEFIWQENLNWFLKSGIDKKSSLPRFLLFSKLENELEIKVKLHSRPNLLYKMFLESLVEFWARKFKLHFENTEFYAKNLNFYAKNVEKWQIQNLFDCFFVTLTYCDTRNIFFALWKCVSKNGFSTPALTFSRFFLGLWVSWPLSTSFYD